jgi:hypothetical protein
MSARDPRNRCEFCDELVWVDPQWRMRHLVGVVHGQNAARMDRR